MNEQQGIAQVRLFQAAWLAMNRDYKGRPDRDERLDELDKEAVHDCRVASLREAIDPQARRGTWKDMVSPLCQLSDHDRCSIWSQVRSLFPDQLNQTDHPAMLRLLHNLAEQMSLMPSDIEAVNQLLKLEDVPVS